MRKKVEKQPSKILEELQKRDGKWILPLEKPVKFGEKIVTELELEEPVGKHMRMLPSEPDTNDMMIIMGSLCGQPDSFLDMMSMKDTNRMGEFFSAFA